MKYIKIIIGTLISAFFLYLSLKGTEWGSVWHVIKTGTYLFIIPAIILHFVSFYIRALKWAIITSKFKKTDGNQLFPLIAIGLAMNNTLPLRAGEFARIFLLSNKLQISKVKSTITLIMERLFDIIGLLLVVAVFIKFRTWPGYINSLINFSLLFLIIFILISPVLISILQTFFNQKRLKELQKYIVFGFIADKINEIKDGYVIYKDIPLVLKICGLSVSIWILEGVSYFTLSMMFHMPLSLTDFIFVCAVVNISSAIPSSPGFIGTFEFFTTRLLIFLGISKSLALGYVLILHLELLIPVTIVGMYLYFFKGYHNLMHVPTLHSTL